MAAESKLVMRQVRVHDAAVHGGSEVTRSPRLAALGSELPDCFLVLRSSFMQLIVHVGFCLLREEKLSVVLV